MQIYLALALLFIFFFISDGPKVPLYFFFTTIIFELSTIIFYIKSNVMPFSAFKLKKTYWQKTIWPPTLKGLKEQYVLEMSPWKTKITDGCHIDLNHSVKHSLWPGKCFQKGRYVRKAPSWQGGCSISVKKQYPVSYYLETFWISLQFLQVALFGTCHSY